MPDWTTRRKIILGFKCPAFTLKFMPFTSLLPLRSSPAAPPVGHCSSPLRHYHRRERLEREEGTSCRDLKPTGVNSVVRWRQRAVKGSFVSGSIDDSRDAPLHTAQMTLRWDTHVCCCWQRCSSPRSQLHVTDVLSMTCSPLLGLFRLNGRWCGLLFLFSSLLTRAASSFQMRADTFKAQTHVLNI